jgi:lipoyl(octanoyl) transferase
MPPPGAQNGNPLRDDRSSTRCDVRDLGLMDYDEARNLQDVYAREIASGERAPTLLLVEHPHVYTFGRRGRPEHLLWDEGQLADRGVQVRWTDRGGDATYHGPGQLVGYPLLPLGKVTAARESDPLGTASSARIPDADYVGYVRKLETTIIVALAALGVAAGQIPGLTGVWVQPDVHSRCARCRPEDRKKPAKIAAIGVKVDAAGVSRHGFALNVEPDMSYWDGIVACGLPDLPVVSLADLLSAPPSMERVKAVVIGAFGDTFGFSMSGPGPEAGAGGIRPAGPHARPN